MSLDPAREDDISAAIGEEVPSPDTKPKRAAPDATLDETTLPPPGDVSYAEAIAEQENPEITL